MEDPPGETRSDGARDLARTLEASDGLRLAYWLRSADRPQGRVLLLLHGAASNHTRWSELVEATRLAASWDLLRPDLRGNPHSLTRRPHGMATWCRDLGEILDHEGYARAVVAGHSLGAQIAVHLARREPERVRGLVLIDPVFRRALIGNRRRLARMAPLIHLAEVVIRGLNRLGLHRRRIPFRDLHDLDEETRAALQGDESFEEIARRYSSLRLIFRYTATANYLRQLLETAAPLPPLSEIAVPVLVLLSGGITFADAEVNRREIDRLPDATVVVLDANHWPLTETPVAVREAMEEWIEARFG